MGEEGEDVGRLPAPSLDTDGQVAPGPRHIPAHSVTVRRRLSRQGPAFGRTAERVWLLPPLSDYPSSRNLLNLHLLMIVFLFSFTLAGFVILLKSW